MNFRFVGAGGSGTGASLRSETFVPYHALLLGFDDFVR